MEKILVSANDAAAMLSIGRSTFFRKVSEGDLPGPVSIGGAKRWRVSDLHAVGQANQTTIASTSGVEAGTGRDCRQP